MENLKIVIVGGSSGIGLSVAKRLDKDNKIIIAGRSMKKLQKTRETLHGDVSLFRLDANNENAVIDFSDKIGEFDHLVVTIRGSSVNESFGESKIENVRKAFDEKFWSQYYLVRHCLKNIKPNGSIILTTGIASKRSYKNMYWHAAANGAIESLIKSLSVEIAPVRINGVSPGFVECKPNDTERFEIMKQIEPKFPMGRLATQDEMVEGYLYLMRNSYTTGTILVVDGGVLCA
jgi:NAD(P)-dependent dehydrogenase (short-subunit alcohol dehydrogenase family)